MPSPNATHVISRRSSNKVSLFNSKVFISVTCQKCIFVLHGLILKHLSYIMKESSKAMCSDNIYLIWSNPAHYKQGLPHGVLQNDKFSFFQIFYMRQWDEDLHLVHTILENSICILVILIRMLAVYCRYRDMKKFITDNEYVSETFRGSRSVRIAMVLYILLAVCMMTVIGGCFAVFYLLAHLGWTVLITNFALTLMYVAYIIFMEQLNTIVDLIRTDQHKAVIHESVLLLKEGLIAVSGEQRLVHYQRTNRFLTALRNTDLFTLPPYIHVIDGFDYEAITLKELESSV